MKKRIKFNRNTKLILVAVGVVLVLVLIILLVLFLSPKTTICTKEFSKELKDYKSTTKYVIKSRKNVVNTVKITELVTSKDKDILDDFEKKLSAQYKFYNKSYGGYDYTLTKTGEMVKLVATVDFNAYDMKAFVIDNPKLEKYVDGDRFSLNGMISMYEDRDFKCK